MATQEMYDRVKGLTHSEIIVVAQHCSGDLDDDSFCESKCPYLDVRAEKKQRPNRFCRQWVMHDLLRIIDKSI